MIAEQKYDQTSSKNTEDYIGPNDVLLGRGGATNSHLGNRKFRAIVAAHQSRYLNVKKTEKICIARNIVSMIYDKGGRFLQRCQKNDDGTTTAWVEVTYKRAQEKTSQALREGMCVRHSLNAPGNGQAFITSTSTNTSNQHSSSTRNNKHPYTSRETIMQGKVIRASKTENSTRDVVASSAQGDGINMPKLCEEP